MKKTTLVIILLLLFISANLIYAKKKEAQPRSEKAKKETKNANKDIEKAYPGYLADLSTGIAGKTRAGKKLDKDPGILTSRELTETSSTNFGVFLRLKNGNFKFYRFDQAGSIMAKDIIGTTIKKDHIYVVVKGTITPDGVIKTSWMQEVKKGKDKEKPEVKEENLKGKKQENKKEGKGKNK